jgi:hypothetical protein
MPHSSGDHTVQEHFDGREPAVAATYEKIVTAAKKLGPVTEEA